MSNCLCIFVGVRGGSIVSIGEFVIKKDLPGNTERLTTNNREKIISYSKLGLRLSLATAVVQTT